MRALQGCSTGVSGIGTFRHFVVPAGHLHWASGLQIIEREIDGTAAVVARPVSGIGYEYFLVGGSCVPEHFGYVPGAVSVIDQQPIATGTEFSRRARQCLGRWPLEKCARLRIDR